jgi:hypothetical protein
MVVRSQTVLQRQESEALLTLNAAVGGAISSAPHYTGRSITWSQLHFLQRPLFLTGPTTKQCGNQCLKGQYEGEPYFL